VSKRQEQKASQARPARELPPTGTQLSGRYRGQEFVAEVVAAEGGEGARALEFQGSQYTSLSAAAKAISGNSVNGWRFWKVVEPQPTDSE
jgi:hypothetical protein